MEASAGPAQVFFNNPMAILHLNSAALFSSKCRELDDSANTIRTDLYSYVTACIISSAAFLEAEINEFFIAMTGKGQWREENKKIHPIFRTFLNEIWTDKTLRISEGMKTIDKYQLVLRTTAATVFDEGSSPFQDVKALNQLRNLLIHPKQELIEIREVTIHEKKFRYFFPDSNGPENGYPYWPYKCLGYGCAKWSLSSAINFSRQFYKKLKLKHPYSNLCEEIIENLK